MAASDVAFGAEISEDRQLAAIVAAGRSVRDSSHIVVDLVFYEHPRDAVSRLAELYGTHWPVAVAIDPRSQSATLLGPLADAGVAVTLVSTLDVIAAHGSFMDLVCDGQLEHLGQAPLTMAVRAAQQRPLSGAQAWDRRIPADQSPLVAATFATWAFLRWEEMSRPGAWAI